MVDLRVMNDHIDRTGAAPAGTLDKGRADPTRCRNSGARRGRTSDDV